MLTGAGVQHVGIRNAISSWDDYDNDAEVGFVISHAEDIEEVGWSGIVKRIREVVGENPVYSAYPCILVLVILSVDNGCWAVSLDIDVIDPGMAPA